MNTNQDWKPIESAPKDGCTLLLGYPNSRGKWRTVRGQWMSADYIEQNWEDPEGAEPGWFETSAEADDTPNCWSVKPTHWMPLPAAPGEPAETPAYTVVLDPDPRGVSVGVYQGSSCVYNGPHPIPTGATGEDERKAFEAWADDNGFALDCDFFEVSGQYYDHDDTQLAYDIWRAARAAIVAPAAGDALALEDLQRLIEYAQTSDDCQYGTLATGLVRDLTAKALATLAAAGGALKFLADTEGAIESLMLEGRNTLYRVWWPAVGEFQTEWYASPQEAVDAAIAQQSQRREA